MACDAFKSVVKQLTIYLESDSAEGERKQCIMTKSRAARRRQRQRRRLRAQVAGGVGPIRRTRAPQLPLIPAPYSKKLRKSLAKAERKAVASGMPAGPGSRSGGTGRLGLSGGGNFATTRRAQVIEEDEYICEINGSGDFVANKFAVNPGQPGTFPWGSKIASLYEKYDFDFLEFYFKREVSEYATNGQQGKVILSFDYDASDNAPLNKQTVLDTVPHVDGMPCTPIIRLPLDVACMRDSPARYVRVAAKPNDTDIKTYDVGNLYVSTMGNAATTVIGELHVRYRVRLFEPVLEDGGSSGVAALYQTLPGTTPCDAADKFTLDGTGMLKYSGTTIDVTFDTNSFTIPTTFNGALLFQIVWIGTGVASTPLVTFSDGASGLLLYNEFSSSAESAILPSGTGAILVGAMNCIEGGKVSVTGLSGMADAQCTFILSQIPSSLGKSRVLSTTGAMAADDRVSRLEALVAKLLRSGTACRSPSSTPLHIDEEEELVRSVHIPASAIAAAICRKK